MSRGLALWLLLAVFVALSTATYGEMYKSLDDAQCVSKPHSQCMFAYYGRRGLRRCECTKGYSCQYRPYDNRRYVCKFDVQIDPDIRKIFF